MNVLLFLIFSVAVFAAAAAAATAWRRQVCQRGVGYVVPAVVEGDPALDARANDLVATWCTLAAGMAAVPLFALAVLGADRALPLWALAALAAYGFLVACLGSYPIERIKQLGDPGGSGTAG